MLQLWFSLHIRDRDTVRLPSSSYPAAELPHFSDPISRLVGAERRPQFMHERVHYEGEYAIVVQSPRNDRRTVWLLGGCVGSGGGPRLT